MRVLLLVFLLFIFAPPAAAEEIYICPMHPHIHGKAGDRCPICGMDLVPADDSTESASEPEHTEKKEPKILYWYDPMVPGQKFDKPGKSPYMDMDLVPFYEEEESGKAGGQALPENALRIDPAYRQALGVRTGKAAFHEFGRAIHAYGHIAPSTRLEHAVDVRTAGWVVDLKTDAVGDTVKKGDLLFTYYSPDLMQAQSDYLIGGRIGNAEQRLKLHGMDDQAIAVLKKAGKFLEETPFYAPADGTVSMLNARKGAYIAAGGPVLTLQDYTQVWVLAHLPLRDMPFVKTGLQAIVSLPDTDEEFTAHVDYVYPMTDSQSRDGAVRLVLDNPEGRLKTDSLVNVIFSADSRKRLAVPEEAVLYGGNGTYVIEALADGYFAPIPVKAGITANGMTEIAEGLFDGADIVVSGQFMIDAESNLRGGMAAMESKATDTEDSHAHEH